MAYTDIIPLSEAKNYLRVDSGFTADDSLITRMINASLSFCERYTSHILFARNIDITFIDSCARVYKFPINSVVSPSDAEVEVKTTYSVYSTPNPENETLTLNVGYTDSSDIPAEIVEFAYGLIDLWYYKREGANGEVPDFMKTSISHLRRFIF
jgi:hypothetical protein